MLAGFIAVAMPMAADAQPSDTRIIDSVDTKRRGDAIEIRVNFNLPMRYVTHVPLEEGDEVVVRLQPIVTPDIDPTVFQHRESALVDRSQSGPLTNVIFEGEEVGNVSVTLRFAYRVPYTVKGGDDFRSIVVSVPAPAARPAEAAPDVSALTQKPVSRVRDEDLLPPPPEAELAELMSQLREAMTAGDNDRAVRLATKLTTYREHPYRRESLELLGLARERKGQLAHAKAEYEEYLARYGDSDGAARVKQRLAALLTARKPEQAPLEPGQAAIIPSGWPRPEFYGSVSQFYYRDTTDPEDDEVRTTRSALVSDINVTGRQRGESMELRTRVTGGYENDFLNSEDSEARLSEAFVELRGKNNGLAAKFGRQSRSTGGILGRFDGALLSYQQSPTTRINATLGYPVDSTRDTSVSSDRPFYNLSVDLGPYNKSWNFNVFYHHQTVDDIDDREAVGGEMRYFRDGLSVFGVLDYSLLYDAVNTALLLTNWTVSPETALHMTLDYRKSPVLTTKNALQGQPVDSIEALLGIYTEDEIYDLARDRTADSKTLTVGGTRQLHDKLQVATDLTVASISETESSGGVIGTPATGTEYYFSTQLIGTNLFTEGDVSVVGLRYDDTSTSEKLGLRVNARFPWHTSWRINPRFEITGRRKDAGGEELSTRLSARVEWRFRKRLTFESEVGGIWIREDDSAGNSFTTTDYFLYAGYRYDF